MTAYDIMYLIGGVIGIVCIVILFNPAVKTKYKVLIDILLFIVFAFLSYLILGDSPIPENHIFPIQL